MSEELLTEQTPETSTEVTQTELADSASTTETLETGSNSEDNTSSSESESKTDNVVNETKEVQKAVSMAEKFKDQLTAYIEGEITDEDFNLIESKGVTRSDFELIASSLKMQREKNDNELRDSIGGEGKFNEVREYAKLNCSTSEKEVIEKAFATDMGMSKLILAGLKARMESSEGYGPSMTLDATSSGTNSQAYGSRDEYIKDSTSFRYKKDDAFRAEVNSKRSRSGF